MMNLKSTNVASTDKAILCRYLELPQPENKVMVTYIWMDGHRENLRGKD
jgi:glutamine synthetase